MLREASKHSLSNNNNLKNISDSKDIAVPWYSRSPCPAIIGTLSLVYGQAVEIVKICDMVTRKTILVCFNLPSKRFQKSSRLRAENEHCTKAVQNNVIISSHYFRIFELYKISWNLDGLERPSIYEAHPTWSCATGCPNMAYWIVYHILTHELNSR